MADTDQVFARRVNLSNVAEAAAVEPIRPGQRVVILADGQNVLGEVGPGPLMEYVAANRRRWRAHVIEAVVFSATETHLSLPLEGLYTQEGAALDACCRLRLRLADAIQFVSAVMPDRPQVTYADLGTLLSPAIVQALRIELRQCSLDDLTDPALRAKFDTAVEYALTGDSASPLTGSGLIFEGVSIFDYACEVENERNHTRARYALLVTQAEAELAGRRRYADALRQLEEQAELDRKQHIEALQQRTAALVEEARVLAVYEQAKARRQQVLEQLGPPAITAPLMDTPELWTLETGAPIEASPAIDHEHLYVATRTGRVLAISRTEGLTQWDTTVPAEVSADLALFAKRLLVPARDGVLYILDAETGDVLAPVPIGGILKKAGALVVGDLAYIVNDIDPHHLDGAGGCITVVDPLTGQVLRSETVSSTGLLARPACLGNTLFLADRDFNGARVYAVDRNRLDARPVLRAHHGVVAPLCVDEMRRLIYVADLAGFVHALESDGRVRWQFRTRGQIVASPLLSDGLLYVASGDGILYAIDSDSADDSQRVVWHYSTEALVAAAPTLWRRLLYIVDNTGSLHVIHGGERIWHYQADTRVVAPPVVDSTGILYLPSDSGRLVALPWHLGRLREAASLLESWEDWGEAGEFWLRSNDLDAARRAFDRAGNYAHAARVALEAGDYEGAARGYEAAARRIHARQPEQAWALFNEAAELWRAPLQNTEAMQRCLRLGAEAIKGPLIIVQSENQPTVSEGGQARLACWIYNDGFSPAHDVVMYVGGDVQQPDSQQLGTVREKTRQPLDLLVEPSRSGTAMISLTAVYRDSDQRLQLPARWEIPLPVTPRPVQQTIYQEPVINIDGDGVVHIRGAAGGDVKRIMSIKSGEDSITLHSAACPHCGHSAAPEHHFCMSCGTEIRRIS